MKPRERKGIFAWEKRKRKERVRHRRLREDTKRVYAKAKKDEATQKKERE